LSGDKPTAVGIIQGLQCGAFYLSLLLHTCPALSLTVPLLLLLLCLQLCRMVIVGSITGNTNTLAAGY
jgi:hypothetical protein